RSSDARRLSSSRARCSQGTTTRTARTCLPRRAPSTSSCSPPTRAVSPRTGGRRSCSRPGRRGRSWDSPRARGSLHWSTSGGRPPRHRQRSGSPSPSTSSSYPRPSTIAPGHAGVAELADAPGLGPGGLRPLEVRLLSPALLVGLGLLLGRLFRGLLLRLDLVLVPKLATGRAD